MSTVPDAKSALLALLRAAADLAGVQIEWAHPGADVIEAESIYFGDTDTNDSARVFGAGRRDEEYALQLVVTVEQYGTDAEACERRMWTLADAIEDTVRANPDLGLDAVIDAQVVGKQQRNYPDTEKRLAEAAVRVRVRART